MRTLMGLTIILLTATGCGEAKWTERELKPRTLALSGVQLRIELPEAMQETPVMPWTTKLGVPIGSAHVRPEVIVSLDEPPFVPDEAAAQGSKPGARGFRALRDGVAVDHDGALNLNLTAWRPLGPTHSVRCEVSIYGGTSDPDTPVDEWRQWMERVCGSIERAP